MPRRGNHSSLIRPVRDRLLTQYKTALTRFQKGAISSAEFDRQTQDMHRTVHLKLPSQYAKLFFGERLAELLSHRSQMNREQYLRLVQDIRRQIKIVKPLTKKLKKTKKEADAK